MVDNVARVGSQRQNGGKPNTWSLPGAWNHWGEETRPHRNQNKSRREVGEGGRQSGWRRRGQLSCGHKRGLWARQWRRLAKDPKRAAVRRHLSGKASHQR